MRGKEHNFVKQTNITFIQISLMLRTHMVSDENVLVFFYRSREKFPSYIYISIGNWRLQYRNAEDITCNINKSRHLESIRQKSVRMGEREGERETTTMAHRRYIFNMNGLWKAVKGKWEDNRCARIEILK